MYFKDGTRITAGEECELVAYMDKNDKITKYPTADAPPELKKKVAILKHFQAFFKQKPTKKCKFGLEGHSSIALGSIYLKKFLVTSHGVIMRLSNGLV